MSLAQIIAAIRRRWPVFVVIIKSIARVALGGAMAPHESRAADEKIAAALAAARRVKQ